ncbi:MAG: pro-sigmaK processing inhibitor BofA family protein [Clostridia bacterium]|nr:pro-sigmaK processing inhibitor BofA family protein [Clostridia bacterium]
MHLSAFARETLSSMGLLFSLFVTLLYLIGYPVKPLFRIVRNVAFSLVFLRLYNLVAASYGISVGINPLTVAVLSLFGVHGFAAMNVVYLLA